MRQHRFENTIAALLLLGTASLACAAPAHEHEHAHGGDDSVEQREQAARAVEWRDRHVPAGADPSSYLHVQILGFNDFHGQLSTGRRVGNRPVGSAPVLAAYLASAQAGSEDRTLIVHAGDHVGASPAASALLQDEPSITFLNMLSNAHCDGADKLAPRCNLAATLGNHEFDEGREETLRLLDGGNHAEGPFLEDPYAGARFPYVSANVVDAQSGKPILPPYVIKRVEGMPIAFIGATLKGTPGIVTPTGVAGVAFLDEAEAINRYIPDLHAQHVKAIVVLIHQGGRQGVYGGATASGAGLVSGEIVDIVRRLHDDVDVVVSGHAHAFTNVLVPNQNGKPILVTQAFSAGTAYADIDLHIDRATRDVVAKSAAVITTCADAGPGLMPDADIARLVSAAEAKVAPLVNRVVAIAAAPITGTQNAAGESALGDLIADAQRAAMGTDFAFMNPGGIRADIEAGEVTWGDLFTVQPFGNSLVKMTLSGRQIYDLLNQQWLGQPYPRRLQVSGLTYVWDAAAAVGDRIVEVRKDDQPIDPAAAYTVTVNSFLAAGGDNFTVLTQGTDREGGPVDLDALIDYLGALPQPVQVATDGRIARVN